MPTSSGCAPWSASGSVAGTPAWARTSSRVIRSGSSRSFGPAGPVQASRRPCGPGRRPRRRGSRRARRRRCAAARRGSAACSPPGRGPGGPAGTSARDPPVDLGVERVAQPQLEPGAEQVAHRGPEVGPPAGGGHDVHAVGQAAGRELLDHHLQVVEVGAQRAPAVDDQEHVAVPVVGPALPAPARAGRSRSSRCRWRGSTSRAGRTIPAPRRRSGVTTSGSSGCRRRRRAAARPARRRCRRRSRAVELRLLRGVVSARLAMIVRSSVLLPLRGPPTTATWPAAAGRGRPRACRGAARTAGRRCRAARRGRPAPATRRETRPSSGSTARSGSSSSRVSGTSSGGSQTWWAAGPWPSMCADRDVEQRLLVAGARPATGSGSGSAIGTSSCCTSEIVNGRMPRQLAALVAAYAHPARRRPGDVRRLEPQHRRRVELEVAEAGDRRAARRRRARRAPPGTPAPRTSAGRSGRTGASPGRAAGPPPAAARPAAGAGRATGRAGRSARTGR